MSDRAQYLYTAGSDRAGPLKIGIAERPAKRRQELQTGHPHLLQVFWIYPCPMSAKIEPLIHRMLAKFRLTGEWFDVPVEKAMAALWIIVESNAAVDGSYEDDNAEDWAQHIGMCLECRGIHEPLDTAALRAWRADNPPDPDADAFRNEAQPE